VKPIWTSRVTQVAARYGEHAPTAATCCNACRTCVQTNAIAGALAALLAVGAGLGRLVGRRRVPTHEHSGAEA
jgi:hypothetical protein